MKIAAVFLCFILLAIGSACRDETMTSAVGEKPGAGQSNEGPSHPEDGARQRPPEGAYKACEGKAAASEASFTDPRGEVLTGTCEEDNGKMVLRPYRNKQERRGRQGREEPHDRPDVPQGDLPDRTHMNEEA